MQSQENDWEDSIKILLVIAIAIGISLYPYFSKVNYYLSMLLFWIIIIIFVAFIYLMLFGLTHMGIKSGAFIFNKATYKIKQRKEEEKFIQNEEIEIGNLLLENFTIDEQTLTRDIKKLRNKMSISRCYKEFSHFIPPLKGRLVKARERLEEIEKEKMAINREERNRKLREENEELKRENEQRKIEQEDEKKAIAYEFERKEGNVFFKENLTEKETQALIENGYYSVSEYSIIKKDYVNVLIKPCLNHSPPHIFLVWEIKNILKEIEGVKNIQEHLTHDADLTFEYNRETFALEIETGTLLQKKSQIKEKLSYLNEKYPQKWMFIVSNKNLLQDYKKLGFSTPRSKFKEKLAKLLKISHPF